MAGGVFEVNGVVDPPIKSGDDNEKGPEDNLGGDRNSHPFPRRSRSWTKPVPRLDRVIQDLGRQF